MKKQSNIIYWYRCGRTECDDEYNGGYSRTFEERFKEHFKAPSPIYEHDNTTGQVIYIRVNNPTLNRNVGKYNLPHIWDKGLFANPELKVK